MRLADSTERRFTVYCSELGSLLFKVAELGRCAQREDSEVGVGVGTVAATTVLVTGSPARAGAERGNLKMGRMVRLQLKEAPRQQAKEAPRGRAQQGGAHDEP